MNPYGRPKVEDKAKMWSLSLYERHREFIAKKGGSKYVRSLLEREMMKEEAQELNPAQTEPQETADLAERTQQLKILCQNLAQSRYLQKLLEEEIKRIAPGVSSDFEEKPQEMAKNSDADSILIRRLKGLSQNFASE